MHLPTFTCTPIKLFLHTLVEDSASHFGLRSTTLTPHQRYDVVTCDNFSAICRDPMHKGEYILLGKLGDQADPLSNPLPPVRIKHRAADGKFALT